MKKLLGLLLILIPFGLFAKQVDLQSAKLAGVRFINYKTNATNLKNNTSLSLVYTSSSTGTDGKTEVYYYVFNVNGDKGFVIVSGDDAVTPILGYSSESGFDASKMPPQVRNWMENYRNQLAYAITNGLEATLAVKSKWDELLTGNISMQKLTSTAGPLLSVKWDQGQYYNDSCPYDASVGKNAVTGCVATAMCQVMKYWGYPSKGSGFHSYKHSVYGTLSASFANTTYKWSSMPNSVTSANSEVARLMYQVGVSVDMNYSTVSSGAYVISSQSPVTNCAEYALKNYFKYDKNLKGVERSSYTDAQWITTLETQLDSSWPVIYAGFGTGGGHCFVCDGYDANNYMHMNWGWSGYYNGFFEVDSLNPTGTGTGGGSGGYNSSQQAIIGIKGVATTASASDSMVLDKDLVTDKTSYYYGQGVKVTSDIKNSGKNDFTGAICVAVFDNANNFVAYLHTDSPVTIKSGKTYAVSFKDSSYSILPGSYTVYAYFKGATGNWEFLNPATNLVNYYANIAVTNSSWMEMHTDDSISPVTYTEGDSATAYFNCGNFGPIRFKGRVRAFLYNLDGTFADSIQTVRPNSILPPFVSPYTNYYIFPGKVKFKTSKINAKPGTYLLAAQYNYDTTYGGLNKSWYLVGSTYHQNPIKVTVQAAPLQPDKYENNDDISKAYSLPVSFSSNVALVNTAGSNIHVDTDQDYYKVVLPTGYDYVVDATLQNSTYHTGSNTFTLDAIFSYSTNAGTTWGGPYNDTLPGNIKLVNGGTVYFNVSPYFAGNTGTYELDIPIARSIHTGIEGAANEGNIFVYPNPAHDVLNIDLSGYNGKVQQLILTDMQGRQMYSVNAAEKNVRMQLNGLAKGVYILKILSGDNVITKRVVID